ncbi:MAG: flagellar FliJ family protein, partial [Selenomonadaceae bacterium]|nr:flagellar FliJ family protein [Selenomonadaceae bacterium]
ADMTGEGKTVTIGVIMTYNEFFNWKREQIEKQQQVILKATQDKQQKLKILMQLMTYLKSIEQLKEKRRNEYNAEVLFEEQKLLDEIGLQLSMRK